MEQWGKLAISRGVIISMDTHRNFLLLLLALMFTGVATYVEYDLENTCQDGSATFQLDGWGPGSAAILKATSKISFFMQMHCRALLTAPEGYGIMVSLREIGLRRHGDGSCQDYLQIQDQPMCEKILRYEEERHFDSLSNHPPNEMDIVYHTSGSGLDNKTLSGYPGFTFTFTAFSKGAPGNSSAFVCWNENKIWPGLTCDGHNNCGDLSDEDPDGDSNCGRKDRGSTVLIILGLLIVFVLVVMCVATLLCSKNEAVRRFSTRMRSRTLSFIPRLGTRHST